jgi:photosystem II stability/assembly factor-like uncharacterized protein
MTLEDRLLTYYQDEQSRQAPPGSGLNAAIARGRRRRRRRFVAETSVITAFAVLAGTMLYRRVSTEPATHVATPAGDVAAPTNPFAWSLLDGDSPVGVMQSFATTAGQLYALSTSPGQTNVNNQTQVLYTSADGHTWAQHALASGLHLAGLKAVGDSLYAVGTAPATVGFDAVLATSTDQGSSWTTVTLPVDRGTLAARGIDVNVGPIRMVTGPTGTLVIAAPYAAGIARLWPGGLPTDEYLQPTVEGLVAQAKNGTGTTKTWAELGISPSDAAIVRGTPQLFFSTDGQTFTKGALGPDVPGLYIEAAFNLGGNFYIEGHAWTDKASPPPATLLRSSDGSHWTTVVTTGLENLQWSSGADVLNGQVVLLGNSGVFRSADGSSWTQQSLADLVGAGPGDEVSVNGAVGPAGVVATVMISSPSNQTVEATMAPTANPSPSDTAPVTTLSPKAVRANLDPPRQFLVASRDGVTFSTVALEQLIGSYAPWIDSYSVDATAAYVHLQVPQGENKLAKSMLLVGRAG